MHVINFTNDVVIVKIYFTIRMQTYDEKNYTCAQYNKFAPDEELEEDRTLYANFHTIMTFSES